MTPEEQKEIHKQVIKEAIQEWLDQQYAIVGKWTLSGFRAMVIVAVVYLWAAAHGWVVKF